MVGNRRKSTKNWGPHKKFSVHIVGAFGETLLALLVSFYLRCLLDVKQKMTQIALIASPRTHLVCIYSVVFILWYYSYGYEQPNRAM